MAEPLDFKATQKAAKNGAREALVYELQASDPDEGDNWQGALSQLEENIVTGVARAYAAGGDHGMFHQSVNTSYSGTQVALYEARLISGPITHPLTDKVLPKQATVFDDILAAIKG